MDAANAVPTVAADLAEAAADLANVFMDKVRKLALEIRSSARRPSRPKGESRGVCGGDNGPARFPGRSDILAQCADMEPGAT